MIKLFVQVLLSVVVGIGAAMGFSPKVRADLHDTLIQANASLHESVSVAAASANKVTAKIQTAVSVKTNAGDASKGNAKADLDLKDDLKAQMNADDASPVNVLPGMSVHHSLTSGSQTTLEVEGSGLDIEAEGKTKSTLNLDLGSGK